MHTYRKEAGNRYTVGYWLVYGPKFTASFFELFDVKTQHHAISAVSILNGNSGAVVTDPLPFKIGREYDFAMPMLVEETADGHR